MTEFLEIAFTEGIRNYLKERLREFDGRIHVSHLLQCLRRSYLEIKHPQDVEPNFNLFSGLALHEVIEEILTTELPKYHGMIKDVKAEVELDNGLFVGTADLIIYYNDSTVVVDIKTTKYNVNDLSNPIVNAMVEKHVKQLTTYVHMAEADYGILLYVKRQNGTTITKTVQRNEEIYKEMIERAKILRDALESDREPQGEPNIFCKPYRDKKTGGLKSNCPFWMDCPYIIREKENGRKWFV